MRAPAIIKTVNERVARNPQSAAITFGCTSKIAVDLLTQCVETVDNPDELEEGELCCATMTYGD